MSKFLTPKAIANRIKSKGLQKIKWYCQMCEKQCRDENGFKVNTHTTDTQQTRMTRSNRVRHATEMWIPRSDTSPLTSFHSLTPSLFFSSPSSQCHQTGESHLRQMSLFREDPSKFMDTYSQEFQNFFMEVMKRKGGLRVLANNVYQEVVADRQHIHMSSTKWETLTSFVQYLGKHGLCKVDQTEKGWFVQYIDRDPRILARQEELAKRAEAALDSEERAADQLRRQVEMAQKAEIETRIALGESTQPVAPAELKERGDEEKIAFTMSNASAAAASSSSSTAAASSSSAVAPSSAPFVKPATGGFSMSLKPIGGFNAFAAAVAATPHDEEETGKESLKRKLGSGQQPASAIDALIAENERLKANELGQQAKKAKVESSTPSPASTASSKSKKLDYWLHPRTIVKILNKKLLNGRLYKQKGIVLRVIDKYIGELRVTSSDESIDQTVLQIDQEELETVIPAIGKVVQVVNGQFRGEIAVLLELNEAKYTAKIRIESGVLRGKEVDGIEYEDICKLNEA